MESRIIPASFFERDPLICARELIGAELIWGNCSGVLVETEAYNAINDEAAHTFTRPSARSFIERNKAGAAYVYFNYGMHWMLNVLVKGRENGFVLIRALEPKAGIERMKKRRKLDDIKRLCSGPGKLTQALDITHRHHEMDLCVDSRHCFARNAEATVKVLADQRIGITRSAHLPWRFTLHGSPFVSAPVKLEGGAPATPRRDRARPSIDSIRGSRRFFVRMNRNKQRVLLGMSGGVDSSVAGYLLREQGYDVVGVTMKVWPQDCISRAEDKCCGPQAVADARAVAHALRIPHYVVDEADQFERLVIDYFASEYQAGRTPNPCVMCNEKLKFGNLWSKAAALGCDYIATGHYAIIEHVVAAGIDRSGSRPDPSNGVTGVNDPGCSYAVLRKGVDPRKDQSYFLFSLRQPQLQRALTPLGKMTKPQIREIAHSLGLKVADKIDSQEICFVPGNDYKAFLRSHLGETEFHRGEIYDVDGNFIAEHEGIELFTIGQRKGLPGGSQRPRYVVDLDPETNRVIVGDADDLVVGEFEVDRVNWHPIAGVNASGYSGEIEGTVKIRYSHPGAGATLTPLENGRAHIRLHEPQRAVTPGQAAVFYDGHTVLGGGWICRTEPARRYEAAILA